ncbi:MAG: M20 family metallopeptidase [Candidatus Dormibacteraeota bacterium]|nr:M20 family metallopeptidase [Candidatus Dormibacteraeota bacterium]
MVQHPGSVDERAIALLNDLIAIASVNPVFDAESTGEVNIADYIETRCTSWGLDVERQEVLPGRPNVVIRLSVPGAQQTMLLETHMDTVALEPMGAGGLHPVLDSGAVHGRGACDAKGSLAAMMLAIEALVSRRRELSTNVVLLAAADEEYKFRGVLKFIETGERVTAAVVGEPTDLRIVVAHKGCVRFRLTAHGRAAHSSQPDSGHNAIAMMATVVLALERAALEFRKLSHPLVGPPTLSIGRIWGGRGVNTVPDQCVVEVDRRLVPGETAIDALREIDAAISALGLHVTRDEPFVTTPTLDTPIDSVVVAAAQSACRAAGIVDALTGASYGSDASKLWAYAHVPSIVLGPGAIADAHTSNEHVRVRDVALAATIYEDIALLLGESMR